MTGYDLDLLRALAPSPPRGRRPFFLLVLLALGVLLAAAEGALHRGADARRAEEARRLEERAHALEAPGSEEEIARLTDAARTRADRVLWKTVLLAAAEALPPGDRLERVSFDAASGVLRLDVRGPGGPPPGALAERLSNAPRFHRFFDGIREEAGNGYAYSLLCERRTEP